MRASGITKLLLASAALAVAFPLATLGQNLTNLATDAPPSGPTALPAPMDPLTHDEILKRAGRGGGGGGGAANMGGSSIRTEADKELPNPYVMNEAWFTMPKGRYLGGISGINMDRDGKSIWVAERCGGTGNCIDKHVDMVIHFGADGKIIKMFGHDLINYPHGLYVDLHDNIWVTDTESNIMLDCPTCVVPGTPSPNFKPTANSVAHPGGAQVIEFSPQGKVLMRLGVPGQFGDDATHFSEPSGVTVDKEGNIYVSDGHDSPPTNARIVKFDKTGKFVKEWRSCLPWQAHQIDCGHSMTIDMDGRLIVSNRGNDVLDVWDTDGKLLAEWGNWGKSSGVYVDSKDNLYSSDSESGAGNGNAFIKGVHIGSARTGIVTAFIPDPLGNTWAAAPLSTLSPEGVTADKDGRIYSTSVRPAGLMARWTLTNNSPPIQYVARGGAGAAGGGRAGRGAAGGGAAAPAE
jgi:hypothetical protein